jgi:peptidoglycan/LPS O-acetylase OafA/YrhL
MHPNTAITYRRDIDGLRAVAVLSVIGFHAFPGWVTGGFIGVDIFFVISGYLITSILLSEQAKGPLRIRQFYERRIRRIFPSLALVLSSCLVFGWFALLPAEYRQLGKHTAAGAAFVANLAYWNEAGYFDTASDLKPLLHLWSLGIEEQFYIAWPAVIFLTWKLRFNLALVIVLIVVASFLFSATTTSTDPVAAFYSPLARSWELLVGSGFAIYKATRNTGGNSTVFRETTVANLAAAVGLLALAVGVIGMNKELPFPGWWALVPTLGTLLLIAAGEDTWINRWLLGNSPTVWIGLISYPLYLWHWPLLSFAKILDSGELPRAYRIGAVVLAVFLAWITYRLVEAPVRTSRRNATLLTLLLLIVCLGGTGYGIYLADGIDTRLKASNEHPNPSEVSPNLPKNHSCLEFLPYSSYNNNICQGTATPRIAIIGDSHAGHLFEGFLRSKDAIFSQVLVIGRGSCPPLLDVETLPGCQEVVSAALTIIEQTPTIEIVLLSSYYTFEFKGIPKDDKRGKEYLLMQGYGKLIARLEKMGKRVYFIKDVPTLNFNPEMCMKRPLRLPYSSHSECRIPLEYYLTQRAEYNRQVVSLISQNPKLRLLETRDVFCDQLNCYAVVDGVVQYKDFNHLSGHGSERLAESIIAQLSRQRPDHNQSPKQRTALIP